MTEKTHILSEQKLRFVLNNFPDVISLIGVDGTYLEALPHNADYDLIGDRNNCAGRNILELLPEEIALGQLAGIQVALSTGAIQIFEQTVEINSCVKHEEVRIIPLQVDSAVVIVRDVTARRIAEENLKNQYNRSQLLAEVSLKIRQSLKLDDILRVTVTEVQKVFEVDRTLLFQFQPDGTGIIIEESVAGQFTAIAGQHLDDPCFRLQQSEQYARGKFSKIENIDIDDIPLCYADFLRQFDVKASMVVPIIDVDSLWGLLIIQQCDRPRQWNGFEIELIKQFADQLAIAITQSQLVESLRKSEEERRLAIDLNHIGCWDCDLTIGTADWNVNQFLLMGLNPNTSQSDYSTWRDRVHPDDLEWVEASFFQALRNHELLEIEYRVVHPDGTVRWVLTKGNGIYEQVGQTERMVGIMLDITDRKQIEIAFNNSLRREKALNQLIQKIRGYVDLNLVFDAATQVIADLLDLEQAAIVQYIPERKIWKHLAVFRCREEIIDTLDLEIPDENNPLAERLKKLEVVQIADTNDLKDPINSELAQQASGSWLMIPIVLNNKIWGSLSVRKTQAVSDWSSEIIELTQAIANQIAISIQRINLYDQLQTELSERKQTEVKLAYSKELAESANKAKSQFLANMSHEIRTPMNGVLGMAQLLATTSLSDEQKSFVQTILDSGDALLTIINDILDFSKIEAGNLELEQEEFDIIDTVHSVCNLLSKQAFDKNISLQCHINYDLPKSVIGDGSRFRQILINLMGNGIKFTKVGSVELMITGKLVSTNPEQMIYEFQFAIADTGIGIENGQIHKLFYPFTQADASINRKFGGTGLGLAICKRLVELMQGTIWVESRGAIGGSPPLGWISEGIKYDFQGSPQSSIFYFLVALPLSKQQQIPRQVDAFSKIEPAHEKTPMKILLVEDNIFNQKVALLMLKKLGYQADVSENGREAVDRVSENLHNEKAYDFIFMDVQMPIMDGRTATKIIRENSASKTKPWIVALTADALPKDKEACFESGMNDYITKPVNIQEIMRSISHYQQVNVV